MHLTHVSRWLLDLLLLQDLASQCVEALDSLFFLYERTYTPADPTARQLRALRAASLAGAGRGPVARLAAMQPEFLPLLETAYQAAAAEERADGALQRARRLEAARALGTLRCGNLRCTAVVVPGLPEPKRKICSGCRTVRYCTAACQKADWKEHKAARKEFPAAAQ
jgi:hypothetical protein